MLAEIETDKATLEVESPADGLLLARFYEVGAEVEVMAPVAAIGAAGENIDDLRPQSAPAAAGEPTAVSAPQATPRRTPPAPPAALVRGRPASSPRARRLAAARGLPLTGLNGSGPGGRILERDVQAALGAQPRLTPVARAMLQAGRLPPAGQR